MTNEVRWLSYAIAFALGFTASYAYGAERVDLYAADGARRGHAIVDRDAGRVDYFDVQSRRLGYGRVMPGPRGERERGTSPVVPTPPGTFDRGNARRR